LNIYITDADYYYLFSSTGPLLGIHDASQFGGRTLRLKHTYYSNFPQKGGKKGKNKFKKMRTSLQNAKE
jgi:hypothetical protein